MNNQNFYPNNKTNKLEYVAYVRKSTEEDERQQMSKEGQIEAIKAQFPELNITFLKDKEGVIGESKSAAKPGRPMFNKMMADLRSGKYQGVVTWHPDRLSRNAQDAGAFVWDIEQDIIKDVKFCNFTFEKTPEGIMMLQSIMSQAQYFSSKLSRDIKRGNAGKRELRGQLIGTVPGGYTSFAPDKKGRHTVTVPDPERFDVIQKAFKMYLTGVYTVPEIVRWLNDDCGYISPKRPKSGGRTMARATFYGMLQNPRYAGLIPDPKHPKDPEYYSKGKYKRLITEDEYNEIQRLLGRRGAPRTRKGKFYALGDLFKCGECDHPVSGQGKARKRVDGSVSKHTYYRCTLKGEGNNCSQHEHMTEAQMFEKTGELLSKYSIDDQLYAWGLKALEELARKERDERDMAQDMQYESTKTIQTRLDKLLDLVTDEVITAEEYKQRSQTLKDQLKRIQESQAETNARTENWYHIVESTLTYLNDAYAKFVKGDTAAKRMIVHAIGQNACLTDGEIGIDTHYWVKPIEDFLSENTEELNNIRTGLQQWSEARFSTIKSQWYTRQDSNLRLPAPEAGALSS